LLASAGVMADANRCETAMPAAPEERLSPLYSRRAIRRRVRALARAIRRDYADRAPHVVGVLKGAFVFTADLIREIDRPLTVDFIGLSSYGPGTESTGRVRVTRPLSLPVAERDVIVVDDVLDTGQTLCGLRAELYARGARSVRICVLLDKPERRLVDVRPDYVGFPGVRGFVAGYGIDLGERYRALPHLVTVEPKEAGS
jgi:hypoxanthine phosphoribosyltransferase